MQCDVMLWRSNERPVGKQTGARQTANWGRHQGIYGGEIGVAPRWRGPSGLTLGYGRRDENTSVIDSLVTLPTDSVGKRVQSSVVTCVKAEDM